MKIVFLLVLILPHLVLAKDLEFHELKICNGVPCLVDKIPKGTEVTLISREKPSTCVVKAGNNFNYVEKTSSKEDEEGPLGPAEFDATQVVSSANCGDLKKYTRGVVGAIRKYETLQPKVVKVKNIVETIDKLVRKSSEMGPESKSTASGYKISDGKQYLDKLIELPFKNIKSYIALYKSETVAKHPHGYVVRVAVINEKVFAIPSQGVSEPEPLFAYDIDGKMFLETRSYCRECDAWSGYEIFEIKDSSIELKHTAFD